MSSTVSKAAELHRARRVPRVRSNSLYKFMDAVATTPLRQNGGQWRRLARLRLSNYERVAAFVALCDRLAPGLAQRWSERLFQGGPLPLPAARCTPYAFGSGATVFRLQGGLFDEPGYILKVYRRTLAQNDGKLLELARFLRGKYDTVRHWYGSSLTVVRSSYFIMHAPLLGAPAVGMVQPFIAQPMRDLFLDFSETALSALLARDETFREQVVAFCNRTLAVAQNEGRCLDFVGHHNVCVLHSKGWPRLAILDFGIFDLAEKDEQAPEVYGEVIKRLEKLEDLLHTAQGMRLDKAEMNLATTQE